jgi:hypothetical protein
VNGLKSFDTDELAQAHKTIATYRSDCSWCDDPTVSGGEVSPARGLSVESHDPSEGRFRGPTSQHSAAAAHGKVEEDAAFCYEAS